jgi:ribosomal peptide maturation radical SAM protein 1
VISSKPERAERVCLVLAPFTPSATPGLGVSLLKAALAEVGIDADVYYAALDFFPFFTPGLSPQEAILEYALLATYKDVGNLFFSEALWPVRNELIHSELDTIRFSPFVRGAVRESDIGRFVERLHGYAERVNDFIEFCYRQRQWDRYDVVGFSSTFSQNIASLALARRIHERHPKVHIVFGGANCEGDMGRQMMRSFTQVHAVVQGEADFAFPLYVSRLRRGENLDSIPGLLRRCESEIFVGANPMPVSRMDELPYPDFSDYFAQLPDALARDQSRVTLPIETSRGCWWGAVKHCVFCGLNPTTMTFRSKSPVRAYSEFIALRDRYNGRNFYAVDNIIDHHYFKTLLPRLEGAGLNIFYETKSNLSEEDVQSFARAGVRWIQPGIEGLSTSILRLMDKGVQGYKNVELLKWCAIHGVDAVWFMLYRFANEPVAAYEETISVIPRLVHLPPPRSPNPVVIDRFSPYFSRREAFGFKNVRPLRTALTYYRGLSAEEIFNISYHFESDLPQGAELPYEDELWRAVGDWRSRHTAGAYFYKFQGDQITLLVDTRSTARRAFLLGGSAHRLHLFLHQAHTRGRIAQEFATPNTGIDFPMFSSRDIVLHRVAEGLDAVLVDGPTAVGQLDDFLASKVADGIFLQMDNRYLALAIDCSRRDIAANFGLEEFIGQRETDQTPVQELSRT